MKILRLANSDLLVTTVQLQWTVTQDDQWFPLYLAAWRTLQKYA